MIVAVVSRKDGNFVLDDEEGLIEVSKEQKDYYESQLQNQPETLYQKWCKFLNAVNTLVPLVIAGLSLHNKKLKLDNNQKVLELNQELNKANKQSLIEDQKTLEMQRIKLDIEKDNFDHQKNHLQVQKSLLEAQIAQLDNKISDQESEYRLRSKSSLDKEIAINKANKNLLVSSIAKIELDKNSLNYKKAEIGSLKNGIDIYQDSFDLKEKQLNLQINLTKSQHKELNWEFGLASFELVMHVVNNLPQIVEAVKDVFIIGADIIGTIASNAWNWMTMPKTKPIDKILHVVEAPQIEEAQEFASYHDEDSYETDSTNTLEIKPMGDFSMEAAAAA